jgi:hypothetical protein
LRGVVFLWLQRLFRFDQEPRMIELAQTRLGRVLLLGIFALIFSQVYSASYFTGRNTWPQIVLAAGLCSLAGPYRKHVLALTTVLGLLVAPDWFPSDWLNAIAKKEGLEGQVDVHYLHHLMSGLVLTLSAMAIYLQRRFSLALPSRWPVLSLMLLYFGSLLLGDYLNGYPRVWLYSFVNALGAYVWYLAYALRDNDPSQRSPLWFELATFHPFYSGTWLPIGLGAANLRHLEAKNSRELAICQLKGIKLLLDCLMLLLLWKYIPQMYAATGLTHFASLAPDQLQARCTRLQCWALLLCGFLETCLAAAVFGNLLVASARMGGFQLLQQTYKPLRARSLTDFWNRISYYFKQTVVDLFFYPAFLGYFKKIPLLRWVFAIFMAAAVGNVAYHFRQFPDLAAAGGLVQTFQNMQVYFVYCAVLCLGLSLSHFSKKTGQNHRLGVLTRIVLFYSLLHIFDSVQGSLSSRFSFLGYLFGLS